MLDKQRFRGSLANLLEKISLDTNTKLVYVECLEFDKYGRLLAEIYYEGESINQWLIDNKYAFEYDGGTKKFWEPYLKEKGYVAIPKENKKPEKVKKAKKENKKNENEKENETEMETEKEKENLKTFEEDGNKVLNNPVGYTPNEDEYAAFLECGLKAFNEQKPASSIFEIN